MQETLLTIQRYIIVNEFLNYTYYDKVYKAPRPSTIYQWSRRCNTECCHRTASRRSLSPRRTSCAGPPVHWDHERCIHRIHRSCWQRSGWQQWHWCRSSRWSFPDFPRYSATAGPTSQVRKQCWLFSSATPCNPC